MYRGQQAVVRFHNGATYALPAKAFRKLNVVEGERFVFLVSRVADKVVEVRVERAPEARPSIEKGDDPKIMLRAGRRVVTRK